jgi:hypothetical protein
MRRVIRFIAEEGKGEVGDGDKGGERGDEEELEVREYMKVEVRTPWEDNLPLL